MIELYKNIKSKRKENGWSQTELAKKVGYSDKSMISKIEKGQIDLSQSQILTFAKVFGCSASDLMGWIELNEGGINEEAITFYHKYLAADKKTRTMIDMLLEEGE